MSDFPVLDAPRDHALTGRVIIDSFGDVEPYVEEMDSWVAMPLRLVHSQLAGWHLELGPYALNRRDMQRLSAAITAYRQASGS
jgi:hypothetical protein